MWCCFQYLVDPLFNSTDLLNKTFYPVLGFRRMHPTARYRGTLPPKWNHWHPPGRLVPLHSNHKISGLVCPNHIWGLDSIYKEHNSHSVLPANIIECIPYWLPSSVHMLVRSPPAVILGLANWPLAKGPLAKVLHTEAGEVLVHFVLPFRGLSWHMGRSHGEELRCLGQQPQAIVRHWGKPFSTRQPQPTCYITTNAVMSPANAMWGRAESCPNGWLAELGAN